jgi:electron transfer flavoprotein-quinone oxidoreductase
MTSGYLAGKAIADVKDRGGSMVKSNLALYKSMLDSSFVIKDLMKHKEMPRFLHANSQNLFVSYPKLISKAAQSFVRVDGTSKLDKEKATSAAFLKARSRWGLISDAVRLARAWR